MVRLALIALAVGLCTRPAYSAEETSTVAATVTAECRMVTLPQKTALRLLPELMEDATFDKAWQQLETEIEKGEAQLLADLIVKGATGKALKAASVEELIYPTEFNPPQLPKEVPKEKSVEFLNAWPFVGITPTAFERREVGEMLEATISVSADGNWVTADVTPQHVRFLKSDKYDAGITASGEHLAMEQPRFHVMKSQISIVLRTGQRILAGTHMLPDNKGMELFFLRITAALPPPAK